MSNDDPLDKPISIGVELTQSGLSLNTKSRAVAAFDRLLGNVTDFFNIKMERKQVPDRAKIEGERRLIEAMTDHAVDRMKKDPDFADRAVEGYMRTITQRQENKDGVVRHALDDLKRDPAANDQAGPALDPLFLNKIERHAEDAATEELRERWGRVLAAEIRRPGTVSPRVMRVVDELDGITAQLFEQLASFRISRSIPKCLCGKEPNFIDQTALEGAGLLVDVGLGGQVQRFSKATNKQGDSLWLLTSEKFAIGIPADKPEPSAITTHTDKPGLRALALENGALAVPVYLLTMEGFAVSRILPDVEEANIRKLAGAMKIALDPPAAISIFKSAQDQWVQIDTV